MPLTDAVGLPLSGTTPAALDAQRDLIDLTLIEAARRADQTGLWQALRDERGSVHSAAREVA